MAFNVAATVTLRSCRSASLFWIILLLVSGQTDHGMIIGPRVFARWRETAHAFRTERPLIFQCLSSAVAEMQAAKPAGRQPGGHFYSPQRSFDPEIDRGRLASVIFNLKFNVLTFVERTEAGTLNRRNMDEHVSTAAATGGLDEAILFAN
jgi:hypothetical protein